MIELIDAGAIYTFANTPVIDVRTPNEYSNGHIPGAVNIPIFENDERARVGTRYHNAGKDAGFLLGLEIAGPKLAGYVKKVNSHFAAHSPLIVYCWRGGMRSNAMAWLFSQAGHQVKVIEGGYKAYRSFVRQACTAGWDFKVLGGMTGSGKTEVLHYLHSIGEQVLDLEAIARHKGSVFGHLGEAEQPGNEWFEIHLWEHLRALNKNRPVFIEDESRSIGKVSLPEPFYSYLSQCPLILLDVESGVRVERLVTEYGVFGKEALKENVQKLGKYLGLENQNKALEAIENDNLGQAAEILLRYYDVKYRKSIERIPQREIVHLKSSGLDAGKIASEIIKSVYAASAQ